MDLKGQVKWFLILAWGSVVVLGISCFMNYEPGFYAGVALFLISQGLIFNILRKMGPIQPYIDAANRKTPEGQVKIDLTAMNKRIENLQNKD